MSVILSNYGENDSYFEGMEDRQQRQEGIWYTYRNVLMT